MDNYALADHNIMPEGELIYVAFVKNSLHVHVCTYVCICMISMYSLNCVNICTHLCMQFKKIFFLFKLLICFLI